MTFRSTPKFDDSQPRNKWDRRKAESARQYQFFLAYLNQPPETRNLIEAYRQVTGKKIEKTPSVVGNYSMINEWKMRVNAYDAEQMRLDQAEVERQKIKKRKEWATRVAEISAKTWERGETLDGIAEELIKLPRVQKKVKKTVEAYDKDGNKIEIEQTIILQPIRSTMRDIPVLIREADRLQRLATGAATEVILNDTPEAQRERQIESAKQALRDAVVIFPETPIDILVKDCAAEYDMEPEMFYNPEEFGITPEKDEDAQ